jgi:hypothetical protein
MMSLIGNYFYVSNSFFVDQWPSLRDEFVSNGQLELSGEF